MSKKKIERLDVIINSLNDENKNKNTLLQNITTMKKLFAVPEIRKLFLGHCKREMYLYSFLY